jgi:hypothetical protein
MNILIVDKFAVNRDPAQNDMYRAIERHFDVDYCSTNEALWLLLPRSDVVFLGPYHPGLDIDWGLFVMTCDKPVIIDNADNEEQVQKAGQIGYQWMKKKIFTSRYLPHRSMTNLAAACNTSVMLLPWFIDPSRVPERGKKTNDIAFICTQYGKRIYIGTSIRALAQKNGWTCIVGEYYGPLNLFLLSRSRVSVIECERKCLTQKYIESALCRCGIVGDVPLYPPSGIQMYESNLGADLEAKISAALNSPLLNDLSIFATESIFIENIQKVIDAVLLVQGRLE